MKCYMVMWSLVDKTAERFTVFFTQNKRFLIHSVVPVVCVVSVFKMYIERNDDGKENRKNMLVRNSEKKKLRRKITENTSNTNKINRKIATRHDKRIETH